MICKLIITPPHDSSGEKPSLYGIDLWTLTEAASLLPTPLQLTDQDQEQRITWIHTDTLYEIVREKWSEGASDVTWTRTQHVLKLVSISIKSLFIVHCVWCHIYVPLYMGTAKYIMALKRLHVQCSDIIPLCNSYVMQEEGYISFPHTLLHLKWTANARTMLQ